MVISLEVKALWTLHAVILVEPPEVAVVQHLAQLLALGSVDREFLNDYVLTNLAVSHSHSLARIFNLGHNCQGQEEYSYLGHSWGF